MLSGRRLDLLDPSPLDIEIADIAHGLARVARWNGQTSGAHIFSVAQHTLLVEAVMREQTPRVDVRFRLAALLHDAPEYVIGDMISPFKAVLGGDYKAVEKRLLVGDPYPLRTAAGIGRMRSPSRSRPPTAARPISRRPQLAGFAQAEAKRLFGRDPGLPAATRARLPDALDRGQGREAVPGAVQDTCIHEDRCLNLLSPLARAGL